MQAELQKADPDGFDDIPENMFHGSVETLTPDIELLWRQIHSVYIEAERCQNHHKDENAWVDVVRSVLKTAGSGDPNDMLEINSA